MSSRATSGGSGRNGRVATEPGRAKVATEPGRAKPSTARAGARVGRGSGQAPNSRADRSAAQTGGTRVAGESGRATNSRDTGNRRTSARTGRARPETDRTGVRPAQEAGPGEIAGRLRDAVLAVPGVTRLTSGVGVEVATLFPGGKIVGIRLGDPVEVHVQVGPVPIAPLAEEIRVAVRDVLAEFGRQSSVEVVVDDIDLPVPVGPAGRS
ncbi:hypothetical protein O7626_13530 [Micromonospora sp. WMMD1102]|uniref:hypothetical protein n=1 Tax=Micromonospora sp. WMMD1102 TaxID=3016105 RepID=UPI0024152460|nr:hypothetical protein [Micromonospora sp. WMMD1102]MDG4786937.1 hypothetical protein [Micromonospora sp. WMMD1102]